MAKGKPKEKTTPSDTGHVAGLSSNQAQVDAIEGVQGREDYEAQLHLPQIELVKLQWYFIGCGDRVLVLLEGRDAANKDGSVKRIIELLNPRETRVVALDKPSDRERTGWYFQRCVPRLLLAEEFVLFNRSWYNRADVESMMGFCTAKQYDEFVYSVPHFEEMLVSSGIKLLKYYFDISKIEQVRRLAERRRDPPKQWKASSVGAMTLKHWDAYTTACNAVLMHTHTAAAPWHIMLADDKRTARLNSIRRILSRLRYAGKKSKLIAPDPGVVFEFSKKCLDAKRLVS